MRSNPECRLDESAELELKIDELLQDLQSERSSGKPRKSKEDQYFDEIVEMLNKSDENGIKPYRYSIEDTSEDETDFFSQVLAQIPKDQLPKSNGRHANRTSEEIQAEITQLEEEMKKLRQSNREKLKDYFKTIELEVSPQEYIYRKLYQRKDPLLQAATDKSRIESYYKEVTKLVKQISLFSPSRKVFMNILRDHALDHYDKVQQVIQTASLMNTARQASQPSLFSQRINRRNYKIHEKLAAIDINADKSSALNVNVKP